MRKWENLLASKFAKEKPFFVCRFKLFELSTKNSHFTRNTKIMKNHEMRESTGAKNLYILKVMPDMKWLLFDILN